MTRMPVDIFPNLNLPVIYVAQPYGGMDPAQMEGLLTNYYEYHFLYITGIHHVESRNIQGMALMKLYFHPGTEHGPGDGRDGRLRQPLAGLHAARARSRRSSCGSTPAACRSATSCSPARPSRSARSRTWPCSRCGRCSPACRASPRRLRSAATSGRWSSRSIPSGCGRTTMSPDEVITALTNGNTISPSGNVRIGKMMPIVPVNSVVRDVKDLETIPIRAGHEPVRLHPRRGHRAGRHATSPTGYALVNGRRAVYILVTKRADASTLTVVSNVKAALPEHAGRPARRHPRQLRVRPVALRDPGHAGRGERGRCWGPC